MPGIGKRKAPDYRGFSFCSDGKAVRETGGSEQVGNNCPKSLLANLVSGFQAAGNFSNRAIGQKRTFIR
jgi:hypothetical protein